MAGRGTMAVVDESGPVRPEDLRVSDADRERVVDRLRRAQAEGRLDVFEFDERVAAAWAARTYRELAPITVDLPTESLPVESPPARLAAVSGGAPGPEVAPRSVAGLPRGVVAAWLAASMVNIVIWGIVSVSSAEFVYPWWVWVAGPWGAVLLAGWVVARGGRR